MSKSNFLHCVNNIFQYGLIILILGLALFPHKLYFLLLNLLFFIPALFLIVINQDLLINFLKKTPELWLFILLIIWAAISITWFHQTQPIRELKRLGYIVIFVLSCLIWSQGQLKTFEKTLLISGLLLALSALIAMLLWPWRTPLFLDRMSGFNTLTNPIIASYTMSIGLILLLSYFPKKNFYIRSIHLIAIFALLTFIIWTWSRGAIIALVVYLLIKPTWCRQKRNYWITICGLLFGIILWILASQTLLERGLSYRPAILLQSIQILMQHPWVGIGLTTPYEVPVSDQLVVSHSHNLFLHIGINLGIPGVFLYLLLWLTTGWHAWKNRYSTLGQMLMGIFVFSTVALQFDGIFLWEKPNGIWLLTWLPIVMGLALKTQSTITLNNNYLNTINYKHHA